MLPSTSFARCSIVWRRLCNRTHASVLAGSVANQHVCDGLLVGDAAVPHAAGGRPRGVPGNQPAASAAPEQGCGRARPARDALPALRREHRHRGELLLRLPCEGTILLKLRHANLPASICWNFTPSTPAKTPTGRRVAVTETMT